VADLANAQESIEEEQDSKAELQKQLVNAKSEAASWKNKFDSEATPRIEELEDAKYVSIITTAVQGNIFIMVLFLFLTVRRKFQQKLTEAEESLANLESKYASLEKTKSRIAAELEDVNLDLEKVNCHECWVGNFLLNYYICRVAMMLPVWRRNKRRLISKLLNPRASMKQRRLNWRMLVERPVTTTQRCAY